MHRYFCRLCVPSVMLALNAGCTVGPNFRAPQIDAPTDRFAGEHQTTDARTTDAPAAAAWWNLMGDPLLVSLETRALAQNLDVRAAMTRIGQSRAELRIAGAEAMPTVGMSASGLRERASPSGIVQLLGSGGQAEPGAAGGNDPFGVASTAQRTDSPPYSVWQAGVQSSWEVDLWGRARRMREAAAAGLEARAFEAAGVRLALSAEVASVYVRLRGEQTALEITDSNRLVAERSLKLATQRLANGVGTRLDVAMASAQLSGVRAAIPRLEGEVHTSMNALAMLLGQTPGALDAELRQGRAIPSMPPEVPVGVPSELAERRPDIREAEAELHVATAQIGVAKASFYPSVNLSGSLGLQALKFSDAGDWGSRQFAVGPVLNMPIFQGGRLAGNLALTEQRQQESAIRFQQTVLRAWHEVDDALTRFATAQNEQAQLIHAASDNEIAFHAAERRYAQGASDYLTVLIAQRDRLGSERSVAEGKVRVAMAMIALYKALGGGWTTDVPLPRRSEDGNIASPASRPPLPPGAP